ncbi:29476_t:CDS:2, partial [Racocetra persica]
RVESLIVIPILNFRCIMATSQQISTSPSKLLASTSRSTKPITLTLPRKSRTKDHSAFEAKHYCNVLLTEKHLSE